MTRKIVDYKIVSCRTVRPTDEMDDNVKSFIQKGWQPLGGFACGPI